MQRFSPLFADASKHQDKVSFYSVTTYCGDTQGSLTPGLFLEGKEPVFNIWALL